MPRILILQHKNVLNTPRSNPLNLTYRGSVMNDMYEVDDPELLAMSKEQLAEHLRKKGMLFDRIIFWEELDIGKHDG
ncbi:MAG: hypothetical protein HYW91_00845 [Candidatus Sungbacteria bacterium]|nr:hypothetical protein [Candidatus Sungbacteria bacterium]